MEALNATTLTNDITAALVKQLRELPNVWPKMDEAGQGRAINAAMDLAEKVVEGALRIIAAEGLDVIPVRIESIAADAKKTSAKIVLPMVHPARAAFIDAAGLDCLLVLSDTERYAQGEWPSADPDAPQLDLNDVEAIVEAEDTGEPYRQIPKSQPSRLVGYPKNKWAGGAAEPILSGDGSEAA